MLDCMATYRGTGKKPCGNILKESSFMEHINSSTKGGNIRNNILMSNSTSKAILDLQNSSVAKAATRISKPATAALNIVHSLPSFKDGAAFNVDPICSGKFFAPLPGNWH